MSVLLELAQRNSPLYWFGWICLVGSLFTAVLVVYSENQINGINAYIKPFKFYLSSLIFVWSMAWFLGYLTDSTLTTSYTWTVVLVLSFELFWITFKAANGELSHFNISTPLNSVMYSLMGIAITIMTIFTLIIAIQFFTQDLSTLAPSYLWGIRLGLVFFVIFALEGGLMGAKMSHTVGGPDGGPGIPFLNWSTKYGDLRIAHFVGMHALQILPILGAYVINDSRHLIFIAVVYFIVCTFVFVQALMKIPVMNI